MKSKFSRRVILFLAIPVAIVACTQLRPPATASTNSKSPTDSPQPNSLFSLSWDDRSIFRAGLMPAYQDVADKLPGASIYHVALTISDPPDRLSGVEEVRYTNQESVPLTELDFAIYPEILGGSIDVTNVMEDSKPVTANHQNGLLRVLLNTSLNPGEAVVIHMNFNITVPAQGSDYYYGIYGYNLGVLSLAHAYPTILVYDQNGWENSKPDLNGDPLFSDTSFYLVSIDAPSNLVLVASGTEVSRANASGRQQVLYADGPARDFYLAASTGFIKQSITSGALTVNSYAPADLKESAKAAMYTAAAAIADFSKRYAPYPYTEFDLVPIQTSAGGVEFPGLTALALNVYQSPDFLEIVVAHEVAHQWFYNLVGNSTQGQPWLDESMAVFATWQYFLDRYGSYRAESYRTGVQAIWGTVNPPLVPIGLPVSSYSSAEYESIVYGRGPIFILALRDRMGQKTFDQFISDYTQHHEWVIATTDEYQKLAENTCACDLTSLFDSWVYPK